MAQITLTIPDQHIDRILTAFTAQGYDPNSGLTQAQYTKQKLLDFIKTTVIEYERLTARANADAQVQSSVDGINLS